MSEANLDPPCGACGAAEYDSLTHACEDCGKAGCTSCVWPPGVDWMWNPPACCEAGAARWERDFAAAVARADAMTAARMGVSPEGEE